MQQHKRVKNSRHVNTVLLTAIRLLVCLPLVSLAGEIEKKRNPETGLLSWQANEAGFSMQLLQILPDYVSAVYSARGLPREIIDIMADYCVFGTIVKNESQQQVSYRVGDWRYITTDGQVHPVKTKTQWVSEWQDMGVAFRWSILPDDQTFEPGDWGQGFTTIPLAPATTFDLRYTWSTQGKQYEKTFKGIRCAPDTPPSQ